MIYILLSYYINCGVYGGSMISVRIELIPDGLYVFGRAFLMQPCQNNAFSLDI